MQFAILAGYLNSLDDTIRDLSTIAVFASNMGFTDNCTILRDYNYVYISELKKQEGKNLILIPLFDERGWHHQCIIIHNKTLLYIEPKYGFRDNGSNDSSNPKCGTRMAVDGLISHYKQVGYEIIEQLNEQKQIDGVSCGILCAQSMIEAINEYLTKGTLKKEYPTHSQRNQETMLQNQIQWQNNAPPWIMQEVEMKYKNQPNNNQNNSITR